MIEEVEPTPAFPVVCECVVHCSNARTKYLQTSGALLGQWEHQAIIRKHIEALGGHVELGTALVGFEQDEGGVTVELSKNINGQLETEKARFAFVVGTDGAHSAYK